ncbi:MAG: hypothetical protein AB7G93_04735 [Bdellovibrionales bacterium]
MTWNKVLITFVLGVFGFVGWLTYRDLRSFKQSNAVSVAFLPGHLSQAHAFLSNQCTACHTPNQGVSATGCISCHANNLSLLQKQSTAFHANISSCKECHGEHRGGKTPPLTMDHLALANLGARTHLGLSSNSQNQLMRGYSESKHQSEMASDVVPINPHEPAMISRLSCVSCHETRDKHQGFFGTSCLSCHGTQTWRIAEYKHPSPNSRSCAQCHQAPPSHYMMHFEMVSQKIVGKEHAKVNQCYLCHQTTSWNDIKGVGWYKHH